MRINEKKIINERINHLKVLIPFIKNKPQDDITVRRIEEFKDELTKLKRSLKWFLIRLIRS